MDPNQQPIQPPEPLQPPPPNQPLDTNQYDFINNPQPAGGKRPKFSLAGGGKLKMIAIGLGVFTILVLVFSLILGGRGGGDAEALLLIAKKQNQLITLAEIGADKSGSVTAQNLAVATSQTIQTDQNQTIALITKNGKKANPKDYAAAPDGKVVSDLTQAETNGRFDEVFINNTKIALEDYRSFLQSNITKLSGPVAKQSVANYYENAGLLLESIVR
ncbi:MAG TPA: hypothetical protein PKB09_00750 [Candidatus Saccharibacteria bacterium]|nr:hypothetical protein [Candidatus Saccharibacteria bacterium]